MITAQRMNSPYLYCCQISSRVVISPLMRASMWVPAFGRMRETSARSPLPHTHGPTHSQTIFQVSPLYHPSTLGTKATLMASVSPARPRIYSAPLLPCIKGSSAPLPRKWLDLAIPAGVQRQPQIAKFAGVM